MQNYNTEDKDPRLWEMAKKRAGFKSHLFTYLAMVPFFWLIWWFTGTDVDDSKLPWPVWPTAGWGIGVFFHYLGAYVFKENAVEKEYGKLLREKKQ
jgi:hypothetical protein